MVICYVLWLFFFFKQKTAYEMRISDWSSDVCSSDLPTTCVAMTESLSPRIMPFVLSFSLHVAIGALLWITPPVRDGGRVSHRGDTQEAIVVELIPLDDSKAGLSERSEERRVGKECVSTCRSRWCPVRSKKNYYKRL